MYLLHIASFFPLKLGVCIIHFRGKCGYAQFLLYALKSLGIKIEISEPKILGSKSAPMLM